MMATEKKTSCCPVAQSALVSENQSHVSSSSYFVMDLLTDQPLDQSLVQGFQRVTVDIEENDNAEKNTTLEQDCFFHRAGTCKFGANCKFNHSGKKARQAVKESERGGQREQTECKFYLTTEGCKYGKSCRFSHSKENPEIPLQKPDPSGVTLQSELQGKEKETEGFVGQSQTTHIECKYYLTTGGCRFGKACRYNHSKEISKTNPPELNSLGLPMRSQEKDCEFYKRTGTCGYGVTCRFHHPDPNAAEVSNSFGDCNSQSKTSQSTWRSVHDAVPFSSHKKSIETLPCLDNRPPLAHLMHSLPDQVLLEQEPSHHQSMGSLAPDVAPCSSDKISIETLPYLDDHPCHASEIYSLPEQACLKCEWSHHQEKTRNPSSSLVQNNWITPRCISTHNQEQIQDKEFPERPGQPECNHFVRTGKCKYKSACRYDHPKVHASKNSVSPFENNWMKPVHVSANTQEQIQDKEFPERPDQPEHNHFMRTGNCKYKSACRYDHPKDQAPRFPAATTLNSKGLPLRPGKRICCHYEQFGICKYGPGCLYNHPGN